MISKFWIRTADIISELHCICCCSLHPTTAAQQHLVLLYIDPEATPKYFSRSLVGKSRSLFSLSELFRDSVHWTT